MTSPATTAFRTLQKAIDAGYLHFIRGLDSTSLPRHPPVSDATIKGHLNAQRRNIRSTKKSYATPHFIYNAANVRPKRTHAIYVDCLQATGRIFTDQSGPFLTTSASDNKYIFILYDFDSNFIDAIRIPSRTTCQGLSHRSHSSSTTWPDTTTATPRQ